MKWRKMMMFPCLILILLILAGCETRQDSLFGEVVQVSPAENRLLLENRGEKTLVLWEEDTLVGSWMAEMEGKGILDGSLKEPTLRVFGEEILGKETFDGKRYPSFRAEQIFLEAIWEEDVYTLADGARLDLRRSDEWRTYYTKEGRPLLREERSTGPQNVSVGGLPGFDQLGEEAQANIAAWYDSRGLLYDLDEELERAWQIYGTMEETLLFQEHYVRQDVYPSACNEELIWFSTSVTATRDQKSGTETQTSQAFRRQNGEPVDTLSLFRCPEEEVLKRLLDAALGADTDPRELCSAFQMEYLVFEREHLLIWFPAGTLPSEEHTWILSIAYEEVEDILWDWAIPDVQPA